MRLALRVAGLVTLLSIASFGQDAKPDQSSDVAAAQKVAVAALNFRQGDAAGLNRARADFTADGWKDFMKHMEGFLDDKGAPTFTSSFVAARPARILDEKDGVIHLRIPGTLTQTGKLGRMTYSRFAIEVYAAGDSGEKKITIQRLKQITCLGTSTACD